MGSYHAKLSPSSADRWTSCTASIDAQEGIPNKNSDASRQGTACHQVMEEVLMPRAQEGGETTDLSQAAQEYVGRTLVFWQHPESESSGESWGDILTEQDLIELVIEAEVVITQEMADAVQQCVNYVCSRQDLLGGRLLVEQAVPIGQITGEQDATGRTDVTLLGDTWVEVMDGKFGRKPVDPRRLIAPAQINFITGKSEPEKYGPHLQTGMYGLGTLHEHDVFGDVTQVTLTIMQPFIGNFDSYTCSIDELRETEAFLAVKAIETRTNPRFEPTFENCFFCRAKDTCEARRNRALATVFDGFGDAEHGTVKKPCPNTLGSQYALVPFVEQWIKDVTEVTRRTLEAGEIVRRDDGLTYKLIPGKAGARAWRDATEAEATLQRLRVKRENMYTHTVISPTQAEKLATVKKVKKGETAEPPILGPRQWDKLQELIIQGTTQPRIVLETNPTPALNKAAGFEDVPTAGDDLADLFGE